MFGLLDKAIVYWLFVPSLVILYDFCDVTIHILKPPSKPYKKNCTWILLLEKKIKIHFPH